MPLIFGLQKSETEVVAIDDGVGWVPVALEAADAAVPDREGAATLSLEIMISDHAATMQTTTISAVTNDFFIVGNSPV